MTGDMCGGGTFVVGGMHDRGVHGRGACMVGEITTAAGGTHPTGIHSCHMCVFFYLRDTKAY